MANTTWSTSDKSGVTLSNGNLTATATAQGGVRSDYSATTDKFYFEVTPTTFPASADTGFGICNASANLATIAPTPINAALLYRSGSVWVNNASVGSAGVFQTVICGVAFDLGAKLIWFRNQGNSASWNGSTSNDPAAGVGGISISAITGSVYACFVCGVSGDGATANFAGPFVMMAPSGYSAFSPTNALVSQVSAEHWLTTNPDAQVTQVAVEQWGVLPAPPLWITQAGAIDWVTTAHAPFQVTQAGAFVWVDNKAIAVYPLGVTGTGGVGTVTVTVPPSGTNVSITGIEATGSVGTPSLSVSGSVILDGLEATTAFGSLSFITDGNISLSGSEVVATAGIVIPSIATEISGVEITTAIGIPLTEITLFSGIALSADVGIVGPSVVVGQIHMISGLEATVEVTPPIATSIIFPSQIPVTGLSSHIEIGTFSTTVGVPLSGQSATANIGDLYTVLSMAGMRMDALLVVEIPTPTRNREVSLSWSDDKGMTFSNPVERSLGEVGETFTSMSWRRLAMGRDRVFALSWSCDVPTALTGASILTEQGKT